ncbi:MAG: Asp-tRNA(Asn)/Glu-tRNA(Gln) amidotransferase subunit GatA, partial [Bacilli bacterium]|nr:Asp-tRNA(Asn)/Glu-tRNA(Gln) amidotransferase subunit GatA [Bacilli bacterium]
MKSYIKAILNDYQSGKITSDDLFQVTMENVHKNQEKCNSFVTILDPVKANEGVLKNIPYALKDNISTKGILTTGSSNTLKDYVPVYDATIYEKLKSAGAVCVGKTVMDEFGLGGTGTTGHTGVVHNPFDASRQAGGSSAGSAACVADGVVPFAIGTDTGDSIRKPAAFCGIVGYKPTYGLISRYGMFPFASSLDHVGVFAKTVYDTAMVVDVIKGRDTRDMTSFDSSNMSLVDALEKNTSTKKKLFYIKELMDLSNYENPSDKLKETIKLFEELKQKAQDNSIEIYEESFDKDLLEAIPSVYICISCAEATSNLSNLTGIIFGTHEEGKTVFDMMRNHRTHGFSPLIKRRLVIGSYVLQKENQEKYFVNAQRVRRLIVERMNELFDKYDALILPCSEGGAKSLDTNQDKVSEDMLALENH